MQPLPFAELNDMDNKRELLVALLVLHFICVSSQYTNGDVRLVNGNGEIGVVEVMIDDEWGTVCLFGFNIGSAAAVCRQLGFLKSISYGTPNSFNLSNSSLSPPVLTDVTCATFINTDYATSGALHILRCSHSIANFNSCALHNVVAVSCDSTLITDNPYNGQVRLVGNTVKSSGLLEIYIHNQWGTVCSEEFNEAAANSVCRQLGYTNALDYSTALGPLSKPVWIDAIHCDTSESCFSTNCIPDNPTAITTGSCANHTIDVAVNCTFTSTHGGVLLSGNEFICRITDLNLLIIILPAVFGTIILMFWCIVLICLICCFTVTTCPLYAHKTKRKYERLV